MDHLERDHTNYGQERTTQNMEPVATEDHEQARSI